MFKFIGGVIGFFMGFRFFPFGMIIGSFIGSSLGRSIDSLLFGTSGTRKNNNGSQSSQDAYRKFYEQFYQNTTNRGYNTGYNNSGDYGFNNFQAGAADKCYTDIGCKRTDSNDDIKKQYRKMVSQYHPDRIAGKGLSDSEVKVAEARFKTMQESYNQIKKEKGI